MKNITAFCFNVRGNRKTFTLVSFAKYWKCKVLEASPACGHRCRLSNISIDFFGRELPFLLSECDRTSSITEPQVPLKYVLRSTYLLWCYHTNKEISCLIPNALTGDRTATQMITLRQENNFASLELRYRPEDFLCENALSANRSSLRSDVLMYQNSFQKESSTCSVYCWRCQWVNSKNN